MDLIRHPKRTVDGFKEGKRAQKRCVGLNAVKKDIRELREELEDVRKEMGSFVDVQKEETEVKEDLDLLKYLPSTSQDRKEILKDMLARCRTIRTMDLVPPSETPGNGLE